MLKNEIKVLVKKKKNIYEKIMKIEKEKKKRKNGDIRNKNEIKTRTRRITNGKHK